MGPRQLAHFLVTARREHIAAAAAELEIDQSTLSRSIARMEQHYGVALFDRVGRGVRLNDRGRVLQGHAERALHELQSAEFALRSITQSRNSTINFGFIPSLGPEMVPKLISEFRRDHPHIHFRLTEASHESLRDLLVAGTLDLALATHGFEHAAIEWLVVSEKQLVALVPTGHRLAARSDVAHADISAEPLMIFRSAQTARGSLYDALLGKNVVFESDDYATLVGLVAAGHGIAVVPADFKKRYHGVKRLRMRSGPKRTIGVTWARSRPLSDETKRFRGFIAHSRE
ncbi:MAG: LysR family transcriptional regulator, partial [Vulcanimicrobiaceae bacterium]